MENYKIKTNFVSPEGTTAVNSFSVYLRTGSNPADNNKFLSHTGNIYCVTAYMQSCLTTLFDFYVC